MSFEVTCTACGTRFALSDDLYTRKVKGRVVTVRCKRCSTDISVDATDLKSGPIQPQPSDRPGMPLADDWDDVAGVHAAPPVAPPLDLTPTVPLEKIKDVAPAMQRGAKDAAPATPIAPAAPKDAAPVAEQAPKARPTPAAASSSVTKLWLVSFAEDDDRELSAVQIQGALTRGDITISTIVWREGFSDWLSISKVPELLALAPKRGTPPKPAGKTLLGIGAKPGAVAPRPVSPKPPPVAAKPAPPAATTEKAEDPPPSSEAPLSIEPEPMSQPPEAPVIPARGPVALSRGLLYVDDKASSTAAAAPKAESKPEPPPRAKLESRPDLPARPKLESKPDLPARPKLESKPDLAGRERPKPPTPARPATFIGAVADTPSPAAAEIESAPDSGTPDLRSLAKTEPKKGVARDDFGFGLAASTAADPLFGPPTIDLTDLGADAPNAGLGAPALGTPSAATGAEDEEPAEQHPRRNRSAAAVDEPAPAGEQPKKRGAGIWIALAAAVLLGIAWFKFRPAPPPAELPPTTEAAQETPTPPPEETAAPPIPTETAASAEALPAATTESPSATTATTPRPTNERGPAASKLPTPQAPAGSATKPPQTTPPSTAKPPETEVALAPPFDKAAAQSALSAGAGQASSCRKEGDPSGTAVVVVTFAPSGRVTSANVGGPPYAGTATGGCIASTLRRAKVPAFSGSHVTVSKTVVIR